MPTRAARKSADLTGRPVASPSSARSFADDVRARTDAELATLLRLRPDLARPAPADLTSLASRATTRASAARAVDSLDQAHLHALEAVLVHGRPVTGPAELLPLLGAEARPEQVGPLLDHLWSAAILWRGPEGLQVTRAVADVVGPVVAGLAPPAEPGPPPVGQLGATPPDDPVEVAASAPAAAQAVLERLAWGPPSGTLSAEAAAGEGPLGEAVHWLTERGLVTRRESDHIGMPREVALALRGGRLHRPGHLDPPTPGGPVRSPDQVDATSGAQASDLILLVDELASEWGVRPPRVLRSGGLSVRDLRQLARGLDVDARRAAFVAEVALGAGLVGDDEGLEPVWAPTPDVDDWEHQPGATRWVRLARAWLASTRAPHLVGGPVPGGSGTVNALGPDAQWPAIRSLRRDILSVLSGLPEGTAPEPPAVAGALRWARPRRVPADLEGLVRPLLEEAEWLGITGRGALSRPGRLLLEGADDEALAEAMHAHVPAPVEHVLLQADLTAVAPGPLVGSLAQFMRLIADVESRGGATVYRFSDESVRRCLDAGWSAQQALETLTDASQTPVPQPLEYLVRDVARRHGQTRVGSVGCYVRSDDETTLGTMLAHRSLGALQLRRIAPTVLVSPAPAPTVLELLREHGFAPVVESATGGILVPAGQEHRTPPRRDRRDPVVRRLDDTVVSSLVSSLRAGEETAAYARERKASRPGPDLVSTDPATTLGILREAAADRQAAWIGYSDNLGQVRRLLFRPDRVEGGRVHGTVDGVNQTLSVHRITGASLG